MKNLLYIGLDVHKDSISIALAEPGRGGEIRGQGKISNSLHAVDKLIWHALRDLPCYQALPATDESAA